MDKGIIHDNELGQAVLTLDSRALPIIFTAHRGCGLDANEVAEWFLKRCRFRHQRLDDIDAAGTLQGEYDQLTTELDAAAATARVRGRRNYADDVTIEAALRGKLQEYISALDRVTQSGETDAAILLHDALEQSDWAFEIAVSEAESTIAEFQGDRASV